MFVTRCSEDEQADRNEWRTEHSTNEAILSSWFPLRTDTLELLLELRRRDQCKASSDDDGDKHEPDLAVIVAVELAEYDRVSEEEGVQHCVDEHDVHTHEVQHWFGEDHGDWPDQGSLHDFVEGELRLLLLGDDVVVAGFFAKTCRAALEDDGCVCFRYETNEDEHQACECEIDPE